MSGFDAILGAGDAAKQLFLWQVLGQVISNLLGPYFTALEYDVNSAHPDVTLSPADLAQLVVRGYLAAGSAATEAAKSGINAEWFNHLVNMAGEGPPPAALAEALRRGIITEHGGGEQSTSFDQGMREGHTLNKWTPVFKALAVEWPTPNDALQAVLEGQISESEGKALYAKFGGDPAYYQMLFDTRGNAPSPLEAIEMANRGIIPWNGTGPDATSYEQAFLEGPWRNKWQEPYRQLGTYVPPERTVSAMLSAGSITTEQAAAYWKQSGVDDATITAFIHDAQLTATQDTRGLSMSAVLDMYYAQFIGKAEAQQLLALFHVDQQNTSLLLAYVDMRRSIAAVNTAVSRIQSLFTSRKIDTQTAQDALNKLNIPAATISDIITTWQVEASVNVKTLTESQIVAAVKHNVITVDEGMAELEAIGYTPYDAWILLSNSAGGPLPNKPPRQVAAPLGAVIPGVT